MYGLGILKSLGVTLKHFVETYIDDIRYFGRRYRPEHLEERQSPQARGIFTVQYPKEQLPMPERYRSFPYHVLDPETDKTLCTACGMCARVCPPQCIWIKRGRDPETGKPAREPESFHIDISICMSCGYCAEFCPFDAIKMGHDYEVSTYERYDELLWGLDKLSRSEAHDRELHPSDYAQEEV